MAVNCFRSLWWALIREATLGPSTPSRVSGLLRAACRVTGMDRQLGREWGEGREGGGRVREGGGEGQHSESESHVTNIIIL